MLKVDMTKEEKRIYTLLKSLDFSCTQCSNCCRHDPGVVMLTKEDVTNLKNHLKLSLSEFINQCCEKVHKNNRIHLTLKEKSNFDCIFWNNGCIVYEDRPLQCRTFPFWPSLLESKDTWEDEKKRCPGLDQKGGLKVDQKFKLYKEEKEAVYFEVSE
ncbi:MAG: YkgJ family cysteine cluster protein [Spirochaetes bacterium]|nr:YkgJ family cysteine cluster protein [Spirochaetota bacterium]